jgi:hypothetical protein
MGFGNPAVPEGPVDLWLNLTDVQKTSPKLIYQLMPLLPVRVCRENRLSPLSRMILTKIIKNIKQEGYQGKTWFPLD